MPRTPRPHTAALIPLAAVLLATAPLPAQPNPALQGIRQQAQRSAKRAEAHVQPNTDPISHAAYDALLRRHVDADGHVDYAALSREPDTLNAYIASLGSLDPHRFEKAPDAARLATLINAYNAFTLRLVLDYYDPDLPPRRRLRSIMDIPEAQRWDDRRWTLAGRTLSLNELEHELIRKRYREPRIHWALVCAAHSCPPLLNAAYTADQIEDQLAAQEAYVLNPDHDRFLRIERRGDAPSVQVTTLFDWYGSDFSDWTDHDTWQAYVRDYLELPEGTRFTDFIAYDWSLNDQRRQ